MAKAKLGAMWSTTSSIVRATVLAIAGSEPPLEAFIPGPFLPAKESLTEEQRIEFEELRAAKEKLDAQIIHGLIKSGKLRRR